MNEITDGQNQQAGRLQLIKAAICLFGRDGFDGTSLRALASEAKVSWGLVRFYFGSKEGLRDAAEKWVLARYIGLVASAHEFNTLEKLLDFIDSAENIEGLSGDAQFLRRALIEERPISRMFLEQLINVAEMDLADKELLKNFPDETWLADPIHAVALRLGYLFLAPQFKTLLGRDVYSASELKVRNKRAVRQWELICLGLEAEQQREAVLLGVPGSK